MKLGFNVPETDREQQMSDGSTYPLMSGKHGFISIYWLIENFNVCIGWVIKIIIIIMVIRIHYVPHIANAETTVDAHYMSTATKCI